MKSLTLVQLPSALPTVLPVEETRESEGAKNYANEKAKVLVFLVKRLHKAHSKHHMYFGMNCLTVIALYRSCESENNAPSDR